MSLVDNRPKIFYACVREYIPDDDSFSLYDENPYWVLSIHNTREEAEGRINSMVFDATRSLYWFKHPRAYFITKNIRSWCKVKELE